MSELSKKTQGEIPAEQTLEYMRINSERMANFENRMKNLEKLGDDTSKKLDKIDGKFDHIIGKITDYQEKFGDFAREEHTKIYNQMRDDKKDVENKMCAKADGEQLIFLRNLVIYTILASIFCSIIISSLITYLTKK